MQKRIFFFIAAASLLFACSNSKPSEPESVSVSEDAPVQVQEMQFEKPVLSQNGVGALTVTVAVKGDMCDNFSGMGICYDEQPMPTVMSAQLNSQFENGVLSADVTGLSGGKTYYFRAFAICHDAILYSETCSYEQDLKVDLGLSVCWASCNVGASSPEASGDYFAWGETQAKTNYFWGTYKYSAGSYDAFSKYNRTFANGKVDGKNELSPLDDAACQHWQGAWRTPTSAEWQELCNKCTWTWTKMNGVNGYKITSDVPGYTGKSIFLPAAGHRNGNSRYAASTEGYYWSSTLCVEQPTDAYFCNFMSDSIDPQFNCERFCGLTVRPVCD